MENFIKECKNGLLPKMFRKQTIETLRTNLLKIAVRAVCSARYI